MKMRYDPLNMVKQKMADGIAPPSIARTLLENWAKDTADEEAVADVAGIIYAAGSETVSLRIASETILSILHNTLAFIYDDFSHLCTCAVP